MRVAWIATGWFLGWLPLVCYHEYGPFGISSDHYFCAWAAVSLLGIALAGMLDVRAGPISHSGHGSTAS